MSEQEVEYRVSKDVETPKFYLSEDVEKLIAEKDKKIEELKRKLEDVQANAYAESVDVGYEGEAAQEGTVQGVCELGTFCRSLLHIICNEGTLA